MEETSQRQTTGPVDTLARGLTHYYPGTVIVTAIISLVLGPARRVLPIG
jgi:hypothetical protein